MLIFIGVISDTFGINGAMQFEPSPDAPETLPEGTVVQIGFSSAFSRPYSVKSWKLTSGKIIFSVIGTDTPESAKSLFDNALFIEEQYIKKNYKEDYAIADIMGCEVIGLADRQRYGVITDVWKMPANDVWIISADKKEYALPAVEEFVRNVDTGAKTILISLPAGFFDAIEA
ncbi:ribosome maturation factor RimM [Ignavibacteria bacterium]|jgi:16S rRNA processing protein RimM|nr:16S rRNA processing protein RimM [Bacteroidota bacterium]